METKLPVELHADLALLARQNFRSVAAEIEAALHAYVRNEKQAA